MSKLNKYLVTGRYMNKTEVISYHLVGEDGKTQKKVSREQLIYLIGRRIVTNCTVQFNNGTVIIRGIGGKSLNELPIFDENNKSIRGNNFNSAIKPKNGDMSNVLGQLRLVARVMSGRNNIGYEVINHAGYKNTLSREEVFKLAEKKMISNATVQNLLKDGKQSKVLKGAGMAIRELPIINIAN